MELKLTKNERRMLNGECGPGKQQAMEILLALAKIYGAKNMVPVSSAQISGVSYKTIGDAGLEYLRDLAEKGTKVEVSAYLNPIGMDSQEWESMRVPKEFAEKQIAILDAYTSMGMKPTCTCTPYLIGVRPKVGEHIAWAESSAVVFANSVLGAHTNREGGPSALCAAICGVTPNYGMHLEENRIADLVVDVKVPLPDRSDFGVLGAIAGGVARGRVVAFRGIKKANEDELKYLGAAMAAFGSNSLFFIEGITPEWKVRDGAEEIIADESEMGRMRKTLDESPEEDIITTGCPHASLDEIKEIAEMVGGKKLKKPLWICVSRVVKEIAVRQGLNGIIEKAGGKLVADTCMVVSPMEEMGFRSTGVNSAKAVKYLPTMCQQKVHFAKLRDLLQFEGSGKKKAKK
ncbi:MAG: aconitase X catalytic domain-containing protein [Candidatus Micrarchaeota archaeon]